MANIRRGLRRGLGVLEEGVASLSNNIQSRAQEVRGQLQQRWQTHRRASADQVRDNHNDHGEHRVLVESNGELRDLASGAGQGKVLKEEARPEAISVLQRWPMKKFLKVKKLTLWRKRLESMDKDQLQEARKALSPSGCHPCQDD